MGLAKKTIKIILCVLVILILFGCSLGILLAYLLQAPSIELEAWPQPADGERLIRIRTEDPESWHPWVKSINEFLKEYETPTPEDPPHAPCSMHPHYESKRSDACIHAMHYWQPCTIDTHYQYGSGTPCLFLRLLHVDQWTPQPYNLSVSLPLPTDIPQHVKDGLQHPSAKLEDYAWLSCQGESQDDDKNVGHIRYIPECEPPGFPVRRLRTAGKTINDGLIDGGPLVAVLFQNLTRGVVVNVECRVWTRDIAYDGHSNVGRTTFGIIVD